MKGRLWFYGGLLVVLGFCLAYSVAMPGRSHRGPLPAPNAELRELALRLEEHVHVLANTIGERRVGHGDSLDRARTYLEQTLREATHGAPGELRLESLGMEGAGASNLVYELPGQRSDIVLVGAHYDSAPGTAGANDNASGVAALLEIVRTFTPVRSKNTLRFVFFANEEPPYFQNPGMGSLVHAAGCSKRGEKIVAMLSLESLAYYSGEPGSQRYPGVVALFYPDRGNFVAFVGNLGSRSLLTRSLSYFRENTSFPSEGAALPGAVAGVGWSDHWAFWQHGYPAIMITDTAVFRDPHYHEPDDVPANLDFTSSARVTQGIEHVVARLAGSD